LGLSRLLETILTGLFLRLSHLLFEAFLSSLFRRLSETIRFGWRRGLHRFGPILEIVDQLFGSIREIRLVANDVIEFATFLAREFIPIPTHGSFGEIPGAFLKFREVFGESFDLT
jgi:hypothetical protein